MAKSNEAVTGDKSRVLARARHAWILNALAETGSVSVGEIAAQFSVSDMTIRRDLTVLENRGRLARTHGGAVSTPATVESTADIWEVPINEPAFRSRLTKNSAAKSLIASAAAGVVADARTLALDVGTTTFFLAQMLTGRQHLKIFTNSLRNATKLGEGLGQVYVPGGSLRNDELSLSDPSAIAQFEALWFDIAFVGVSGMTSAGIYDYSFDDTEMKRIYLKRSTRKIVLCDASKFNCMSLVHIAPLSDFDLLICDAAPPADIAEALKAADVEILVAA